MMLKASVDTSSTSSREQGLRSTDSPGRRSAFYLVWAGQLVSLLGSGASSVVLSLFVYRESGSAALLGTVLSIRLFASIFAAPFIGNLVDRFPRKRVILTCDISLALASTTVAVLIEQHFTYIAIFPILIVAGFLDCALTLVLSATVRLLRQEADLTAAAGITASIQSMPSIVAPAIGALLYETFPAWVTFAVDGLSFLMAAVFVCCARWPMESRGTPPPRARSRVPFKGATSGLRYIWNDPGKRNLQLCFSLFNLLNGLSTSMLLALILHHFTGGAKALGSYNSAVAVGTSAGAAWASRYSGRYRRDWVLGSALICAAIFGRMGLLAQLAVSTLAATGIARGASVAVSNVPLTAVWMEKVPADQQGSVFGARRLLGQGPYPLALITGGLAADMLLHHGENHLLFGLGAAAAAEACIGFVIMRNQPSKVFLSRSLSPTTG